MKKKEYLCSVNLDWGEETMSEKEIHIVYFLGIGGIGMSALARYCKQEGYQVAGYDRTPSALTLALEQEGVAVTYDDTDVEKCMQGLDAEKTLVVRTPAVPEDEPIYAAMREKGFRIVKRAELLGLVTRGKKALCIAGTHGKTTTSTMLAHILRGSHLGANAFLGGISNNYKSNLLLDAGSEYVVVEADEFDRSFHHLRPYMSVITGIDPDHLDIYGTEEGYQEGFNVYAGLVNKAIVLKAGYCINPQRLQKETQVYTYTGVAEDKGGEKADFYAENVEIKDGEIWFDFVGKGVRITHIRLGVPVWVNIENSVAAMAMAWLNGVSPEECRKGIEQFAGVYRRFNIHVKNNKTVYIDDYAHHPTELSASIESVRKIYPERELWVVFQPHLYTRTRDFMNGFARVLSKADKLLLLPIYPAREKPIAGVSSEALAEEIRRQKKGQDIQVVEKEALAAHLREEIKHSKHKIAVMSLGAGDIDRLVETIRETLTQA